MSFRCARQEELAPLSAEQQRVLDLVLSGRSVFFTGCAGMRAPALTHRAGARAARALPRAAAMPRAR